MLPLGVNEIREKFLKFFEEKEHLRINSHSLVPHNDNSLLLINSGMAPLKPYFTGAETPPKKRLTNCQKCIRTGDIENVGITTRHGTFFEMLGCFSFGDYFKKEIIPWSYEFLTKALNIPEEKIFASVYHEDQEAHDIWSKIIPVEKIVKLGKEDNFWEVGVGPCGPCSELYYDRGIEHGCGSDNCAVGCECDRFLEIWNLVFTQFSKEENGTYSDLETKGIDTGMGLERMAMVMQNVSSIFDVDTSAAIRATVCELSNTVYGKKPKLDISIRIITDHIKSITFMCADGVLPSNEGRGYVMRRLLRRAVRHGKLLGINSEFLKEICEVVIRESGKAYPELVQKKDSILKILSVEENNFYKTLDAGMEMLDKIVKDTKATGQTIVSGEVSFKMYDTYGFPLPLMEEILSEHGLTVDTKQFEEHMKMQKDRARAARGETNYMGTENSIFDNLDPTQSTKFIYDKLTTDAIVTDVLENGDNTVIITDITTAYATNGGQLGDIGTITSGTNTAKILDCIKVGTNKHALICETNGIKKGDTVVITVDKENRNDTMRNHTAVHLLHSALKQVLGNHVEQAGSEVSAARLRFDFSHFEGMSNEDLTKVEDLVNSKIFDSLDVDANEKSLEQAKKEGALALFGEKYGDTVRVVSIDDFSTELCGGTHVNNTSQIGMFKIMSESSVASGVRRIEALTGKNALSYFRNQNMVLKDICEVLKTDNPVEKSATIIRQNKELKSEIEKLSSKLNSSKLDDIKIEEINGKKVFIAQMDMDINALRTMGDQIKDKEKSVVAVLVGVHDEKVNIVVTATDDMVKAGVHAGNIAKELATLTGGSGGGRPNMAQAGGKDITKIGEALKLARSLM